MSEAHDRSRARTRSDDAPEAPLPRSVRLPAFMASASIAIVVGALPATPACGADATEKHAPSSVERSRPTDALPEGLHGGWTRILERHVRDGVVDYEEIQKNSSDELGAYLTALQSVSRNELVASSRNAQLAFWINAYNAFTVRLILDHYPVEGIWKVVPFWKRAFGGPFALDFIPLGRLAPEPRSGPLSLGFIEHEILRAHFAEPRIHFAIVCASTSCPSLASEAYRARDLDEAFAAAAQAFLAAPEKNRYEAATNTLWASPIFDWFADDFAAGGGPAGYFTKFGPSRPAAELRRAESPPKIEYTAYDWALNGR
jgi:hypothetical protein